MTPLCSTTLNTSMAALVTGMPTYLNGATALCLAEAFTSVLPDSILAPFARVRLLSCLWGIDSEARRTSGRVQAEIHESST